MLALISVLADCAASGHSTLQATAPTTSPTVTPGATPTPPGSCAAAPGSARLGDLVISAPEVLYGFNADYMLPDGLATNKPLTVTLQDNEPYALGSALGSRPAVHAAYVVTVCNTSSAQAYRLTSFGVMLASLRPYNGRLNTLNGCAFLYSRPNGTGGECASGYSPDLSMTFKLSDWTPSRATAIQNASQPVRLAAGRSVDISFDSNSPSTPAITTYGFGLGVDGAAVVFPPGLVTPPEINATIVRRWAGDYCGTPQMQAQIPATIPSGTYYACPQ
jgi:hypothetical protein